MIVSVRKTSSLRNPQGNKIKTISGRGKSGKIPNIPTIYFSWITELKYVPLFLLSFFTGDHAYLSMLNLSIKPRNIIDFENLQS